MLLGSCDCAAWGAELVLGCGRCWSGEEDEAQDDEDAHEEEQAREKFLLRLLLRAYFPASPTVRCRISASVSRKSNRSL